MKISARVIGDLARFDAARLAERLRVEIERDLQASLATDRPLDAAARRAALEEALSRVANRR